jgi:CheY-like chemotaxis protein
MERHALIIEDEVLIALEMESLLAELGFRSFEVADTPGDALKSARRARPDLITADYRIIGGTGVEAVEAILAELGPIPVVYVTGNPDMIPGQGRPVVDKPINGGALARACRSVCHTPN